jgi:hypothetical protein
MMKPTEKQIDAARDLWIYLLTCEQGHETIIRQLRQAMLDILDLVEQCGEEDFVMSALQPIEACLEAMFPGEELKNGLP